MTGQVLLVVDDNEADRYLIRRLLQDGAAVSMELVEADGPAACLEAVTTRDVTVVLLDQRLGGTTGLELLDALPHPPSAVVLMTGQEEPRVRALAARRGVSEVVIKGEVDRSTLATAITTAAVGR